MKRLIMLFLALTALLAGQTALAGDYRYVSQDTFKQWLEGGKAIQIVDIQTKPEFAKHHFKGAIETNAYPVKSDEERQRLAAIVGRLEKSRDEIVIICPRGGGGAKNTYDYLKAKGIAEQRLLILEKGAEGWPYRELVTSGQ